MAEKFEGEVSEAADRYARAVFDLAKDTKQLEVVEQDFAKFATAWKESADLRDVARSPLIDPVEKSKALVAVADKLGLSDLGRKTIGAVAQNRRAAELPQIATAYRGLVARERGARQVEVIFARTPGEQEKNAVVAALGESSAPRSKQKSASMRA
ncbi:MAG: ATP synthase F1 subunit delta [Hyphomonadaceae bacterium]